MPFSIRQLSILTSFILSREPIDTFRVSIFTFIICKHLYFFTSCFSQTINFTPFNLKFVFLFFLFSLLRTSSFSLAHFPSCFPPSSSSSSAHLFPSDVFFFLLFLISAQPIFFKLHSHGLKKR